MISYQRALGNSSSVTKKMPSVSFDSSLGYAAMLPAHWMPLSNPMIPPFRDFEVKNGIQASHVASNSKKEHFRHNSNTVNELQRCYTPKKTGGVTVYGYRHYSPKTGQFLGRDPIQERGGMNLYGFVGNDGVDRLDHLGLERWYSGKAAKGPGFISFFVDYTFSCDSPPEVTDKGVGGPSHMSGMPFGWDITMTSATFTKKNKVEVTFCDRKTCKKKQKIKYNITMEGNVKIAITLGIKIGPFNLGPTDNYNVPISANFSTAEKDCPCTSKI